MPYSMLWVTHLVVPRTSFLRSSSIWIQISLPTIFLLVEISLHAELEPHRLHRSCRFMVGDKKKRKEKKKKIP